MALKVEELQVLISANADQFKGELIKIQSELRKLNGVTKGVSDSVGGNLFGSLVGANVIGNALTGTLNRMMSSFGNLTKSIFNNGSAYSRLKVATETVTANLGITRVQLQGLRDDLADANTYGIAAENVIRTLALSGLVQLSESLSAVDARTGETKKGVTALTLSMKDLAAANAIDSDQGIERLAKFIQRGEASFADGLIELSNMNREYKDFAASLGKDRQNLTATEEAQARLNIVMREGQKAFGAYANTYESSGKIFSSVKMIFRSLAETLGAALEPVFRVGGSALLQFLRGIQASLFQTEGSIQSFANKVAGYMLAMARIIGRILMKIPVIGKNFEGLANLTMKPIKAQGQLKNAVGGTSKGMDNLADSTAKAKKELMGLASFDEMNVLNPQSGSGDGSGAAGGGDTSDLAGGAGGGLGDAIVDSSAEINKFADQASEKFNKIGDAIKKFMQNPIVKFMVELAKHTALAFLAFKIGLPIIKLLLSPLTLIVGWFMKLQGVFVFLKPFMMTIFTFFAGLSAPVLLVVAAIVALVAIFALLYTQSEQFRESINSLVEGAFTWIKDNLVPIFQQIIAKVQEMVALFVERWPEIQKAIEPLIAAIGKFLVEAFKLLGKIVDWLWKTILKPLLDFVLANIVPAFNLFLDVVIFLIKAFSDVAAVILSTVMPVMNAMWTIFSTVFGAIMAIANILWNIWLKPIFKAIFEIIQNVIIPVIKFLWNQWQSAFNAIRSIATAVWEAILSVVRKVIDWFNANIMPSIERIRDKMIGAFNKIKEVAGSIWEGIKSTFKNGINGVIGFVNDFINKINGLISKVNSVASKLPGVGTIDFQIGQIPKLATGGAINSPTLAALGEGGYKEAVVPLDRNTEWAVTVADLLRDAGGTNGGNTIIVQLGEEKIYEKFVDFVNDKSVASNMTILNV